VSILAWHGSLVVAATVPPYNARIGNTWDRSLLTDAVHPAPKVLEISMDKDWRNVPQREPVLPETTS
jgi:hypothetical protein